MKRAVIGCDSGISGAWAVNYWDGIEVYKPPFHHYKDRYSKPVLDVDFLHTLMTIKLKFNVVGVYIEPPQIRLKTNSRKTVAGIWWYAGILDTFFRFVFSGIIDYVDPKQWQSVVFREFLEQNPNLKPKSKTDSHDQLKLISKRLVAEEYGEDVLIPPNGKVPNDGFADAICISKFGCMVADGEIELRRTWVHNPTSAKKIRRK